MEEAQLRLQHPRGSSGQVACVAGSAGAESSSGGGGGQRRPPAGSMLPDWRARQPLKYYATVQEATDGSSTLTRVQ